MRISKKLMILAAGLLLLGACNLDYEYTDSIPDSGEGGGGEAPIDELLTTAYARLGNVFHDQAQTYALTEHPSDEMLGPTRGTDWSDNGVWRSLHTHNWDPTHPYVRDSWNALNESIFRTQEVIERNPNAQQLAEASFLRAYYMFHVVDFWRQVPIRSINDGPEVDPKVLNRAEATNQVISDLETAIPNLPDTGGPGRATKAAARTLLMKTYLNKAAFIAENPAGPFNFEAADMDKVIALADQITGYDLADNYFDNFSPLNAETSPELIFTIPNKRGAGVNGSVQNRYYMTTHYNQNPSGWNGFTTLSDFYSTFQQGDQRLGGEWPGVTDVSGLRAGFLVGQQFDKDGNKLKDRPGNDLVFTEEVKLAGNNERTGIRVIKYLPDYENLGAPENDYVLLRYADVLLMKAEALLRKGQAGDALTIVNQVREKRGAAPLGSVDETSLLAERGREFYWEGWRRNDQVRFGTYTDAWQDKLETPAFRILFPVPQQAIDSNPNLQQNEGY